MLDPQTTALALKDKSVLFTGGASGIGLGASQAFAAAGAYVTIADIQPFYVAQSIINDLTEQGYHAQYVYCDATNYEDQIRAFKAAIRFGPRSCLDVVGMFAGVASDPGGIMDHLEKVTASLSEDLALPSMKCIDVNLIGVYYSTCLALNYFRLKPTDNPSRSDKNRGTDADGEATHNDEIGNDSNLSREDEAIYTDEGVASAAPPASKSLIFINSMAGYLDLPKHAAYNASKFGCRGLFRSVRSTTKDIGVRCNLIAPWWVRTPLTKFMQDIPTAKGISWIEVGDVVDAVITCAVDEQISGRALAVLPNGLVDLNDDLETLHGGVELKSIVADRRAAGDFVI